MRSLNFREGLRVEKNNCCNAPSQACWVQLHWPSALQKNHRDLGATQKNKAGNNFNKAPKDSQRTKRASPGKWIFPMELAGKFRNWHGSRSILTYLDTWQPYHLTWDGGKPSCVAYSTMCILAWSSSQSSPTLKGMLPASHNFSQLLSTSHHRQKQNHKKTKHSAAYGRTALLSSFLALEMGHPKTPKEKNIPKHEQNREKPWKTLETGLSCKWLKFMKWTIIHLCQSPNPWAWTCLALVSQVVPRIYS